MKVPLICYLEQKPHGSPTHVWPLHLCFSHMGIKFLPCCKTRQQSTLERAITFWLQLAIRLVLISAATLTLSVAFLSICVQIAANLKLGHYGSIPQNFQFLIRYFLGSILAQVWDWTVRSSNSGWDKRFIFLQKKSSPTLGLAHVPIQWVLTHFMGNEAEAWCSPLTFF